MVFPNVAVTLTFIVLTRAKSLDSLQKKKDKKMSSDGSNNTDATGNDTTGGSVSFDDMFTAGEAAKFSEQGASIVAWPGDEEWKDPLAGDGGDGDEGKK